MTIKQLGGVFGRNPTFNDVTIEGQLTFDGDIDINSDLTVDGTLKADALRLGSIVPSYNVLSSARNSGGSFEWGHSNSSGYPSTMGAEGGSGSPYIAFNAGPGTNSNTYKTLGILGTVIKTDTSGNLRIGRLTTASADNQTPVESAVFTNNGNLQFPSGQGIDFSPTAGTGTSELFDDYEEANWSPVLTGSTSGSQTFTNKGRSTLVGRLMSVEFGLEALSSSDVTGNLIMSLPVTYTGASIYVPIQLYQLNHPTNAYSAYGFLEASTAVLKLFWSIDNAGSAAITNSDLPAGADAYIRGTFSYITS